MIRVILGAIVGSVISGGCGSLFSSDTIETATEAARAACRAIARDYTPEMLQLLERIAAIAERDACAVVDPLPPVLPLSPAE